VGNVGKGLTGGVPTEGGGVAVVSGALAVGGGEAHCSFTVKARVAFRERGRKRPEIGKIAD